MVKRILEEINRVFYEFSSHLHQNAMLTPTKCSAISYKTQCYLLQNAVLSPAKRKVKCSKTQNKMLCFADRREIFCLKNDTWITCFWTEKWRKKWVFTTKKRFLGRRKTASQTPNRTPKRYKKAVLCLNLM